MEIIWTFWFFSGLIMGLACCHLAFKGTEDDGNNQRDSERELDRDTDVRIYIPLRSRGRRSDNGRTKQLGPEEKAIVLRVILHDYNQTLSPGEKQVIEEIIDEKEKEAEQEENELSAEGAMKGLDEAVKRLDNLTARRKAR